MRRLVVFNKRTFGNGKVFLCYARAVAESPATARKRLD